GAAYPERKVGQLGRRQGGNDGDECQHAHVMPHDEAGVSLHRGSTYGIAGVSHPILHAVGHAALTLKYQRGGLIYCGAPRFCKEVGEQTDVLSSSFAVRTATPVPGSANGLAEEG